MNKLVAIGVVIAAVVVAIFVLRSDAEQPTESVTKETVAENAAKPAPSSLPTPVRISAPPAKSYVAEEPLGRDEDVDVDDYERRNYVRDDGTVVRDHRDEPGPQNLDRRVSPPKEISPVQPEVLAAVRRSVRPGMMNCIAEMPEQSLEEGAKAQAELTVSIVDALLQVDELVVRTEGVPESEELRSCVREAILGHEVMVEGAKDVKSYVMNFPYRLGKR